jgi:hypothetical protein
MVLNRICKEKPTRKVTPLGLQYTVAVRPVAPGVMMGKPYGLECNFLAVHVELNPRPMLGGL